MPNQIRHDTASWDVEILCEDPLSWEPAWIAVLDQSQALSRFKGRLAENGHTLYEYLHLLEVVCLEIYRLYNYANQRVLLNDHDTEANEMLTKSFSAFGEINDAISFESAERAAITPEQLEAFLHEEPRLERWEFELRENRRFSGHSLNHEQESVLQLAIDAMQANRHTFQILRFEEIQHAAITNTDGHQIEVVPAKFLHMMRNPDRELRRQAQASLYGGIRKHASSLANVFFGEFKKLAFLARAKRYASVLESALFADNLPNSLPEQTVSSFDANLHVWHRYFEFKRQRLQVDSLAWYDIAAPLGGTQPVIPYEKAVEWIVAAMKPLGEEYSKQLELALTTERWVDRLARPHRNATTAAYTAYGSKPRVIVSYNNDFASVSTLAHEIGHAMHFKLASDHQPVHYAHQIPSLSCEVAANFHQAMLRRYVLEHEPDPAIQLAVLEEELEFFELYFLYMPTLTKIELAAHQRVWEGSGLSASWLGEQCQKHFNAAYGPALGVDDDLDLAWTTAGILMDRYYAFQYLPGFAAGERIASLIHGGNSSVAGGYLDFARAGASAPQLDLLRLAGIDFESDETIKSGFATLADRIDRLERLLD